MKKGLLAFLIVTLLAMSVSVFAADESYKFVGTASNTTVSVGEEFTVNFVLSKSDGAALDKYNMEGATNTVEFRFNKDSFELVELTSFLYGYSFDTASSTKLNDANEKGLFAANGNADADFDFTTSDIVSLKFKAKDTASAGDTLNLEAITLNFVDADGEWELLTGEVAVSIDAVTVKGSTPEKPATAEIDAATVTKGTTAVGNDGTEYTDVPTYIGKVTINNIGSKKVVLTPVATLNGVAHTLKSAPTITFDNTALEEGKVEFKFALIGAPTSGVELTAKVDIVD